MSVARKNIDLRNIEMPHNIEAEQAVLGALMVDNQIVDEASRTLQAEHFYEPVHGDIYSQIVAMVSRGQRATPITIKTFFKDDDRIAQLGGLSYFGRLTENPAMIGCRSFITQIVQLAELRSVIQTCRETLELATGIDDYDDLASRQWLKPLERTLLDSLQSRPDGRKLISTASQAAQDALDYIAVAKAHGGVVGAKCASVDEWDVMLGGMEPGCVYILGGRPSMGKTALASSLSLGWARNGHGVLFVSLEMTARQLGQRMLSDLTCSADRFSRVPYSAIRKGYATEPQIAKLRTRVTALAGMPITIYDPASLTTAGLAMAIRSNAERLHRDGKRLEVVVIDYLQLLRPAQVFKSRYEAMSEISQTIKQLAKECDVAILALAQLNRQTEGRDDKVPTMSDLRDSGQIEQDADAIVFVHRDAYYLERSKGKDIETQAKIDSLLAGCRNEATLICAKQRAGEAGKHSVKFIGECQAFRSNSFQIAEDWGNG